MALDGRLPLLFLRHCGRGQHRARQKRYNGEQGRHA